MILSENKKIPQQNHFEKNNYVFQLQLAPTTAVTNLHKTVHIMDQCRNVQIFKMCRFCADFVPVLGEMCRFFVFKLVQISVAPEYMDISAAL